MRNFQVEQSTENLTAHAGLALVGQLLSQTDLSQRLKRTTMGATGQPDISNADVVRSYLGLLCLGTNDFDHIEIHRKDSVFKKMLGIKTVPSAPTLRQRLEMAPNHWNAVIQEAAIDLLAQQSIPLKPCWGRHLALDADVSPFDNSGSHKEKVSRTYKGFDGYSPMFGYLGGYEGLCLGVELRAGKDHCQNGTPAFLRTVLARARQLTNQPLLVRLDAGNDAADNITVCREAGADFIIKRNLRKEDPRTYLTIAQTDSEAHITRPRAGKTVYRGVIDKSPSNDTPRYLVYAVTMCTSDAKGQLYLIPDIEVDTWWTSLKVDAETVIELYHEHGTCEQFHAEFKTDLDAERLPSGKFEVNALVLSLTMLTFNLLRVIGQKSLEVEDNPLPSEVWRRRLATVIKTLITIPCRLVYHARYWKLHFGKYCPFFHTFRRLYYDFAASS